MPSLVVPFVFDQSYWGQRMAKSHAGPRPVLFRELSAARLAAAIGTALSDDDIRRGAATLGAALRAEHGLGRAVEIVSHLTDSQ